MGEFLLAVLGFNDMHEVVYTINVPRARYKVGDKLPIFYPHAFTRKNPKPYYRVGLKAYPLSQIHLLLETGEPDVIDKDTKTPAKRMQRDKDIAELLLYTKVEVVARSYGWTVPAVRMANDRHKARLQAEQAERIKKAQHMLSAWDEVPD